MVAEAWLLCVNLNSHTSLLTYTCCKRLERAHLFDMRLLVEGGTKEIQKVGWVLFWCPT